MVLSLLAGGSACDQVVGADFDGARPRPVASDHARRRCDRDQPFGAPMELPLNDEIKDAWGARLTSDELSMYFTRDDEVYVATRQTVGEDFTGPVPLVSVNSAEPEMAPSVTGDGLRIVVEVARPGDWRVGIASASRSTRTEDFSALALLDQVNSTDPSVDDMQPYVLPDGAAVYFASTRGGGVGADIFRSARDGKGYGRPERLPAIQSNTDDRFPVVSADELTLYFGSARAVPGAQGGLDVFMARRAQADQPFGAPVLLVPVSSADVDVPTWISPDDCSLYLTRQASDRRIYVARRPERWETDAAR